MTVPNNITTGETPAIAIPDIGPYKWTVEALAKEVQLGRSDREFRMAGFFGPWGSGKTTLLYEVQRRVDELRLSASRKAKLEVFDAWAVRDDDNLPLAIIAHLIEPDPSKNWFETLDGEQFKRFRAKFLTGLSTVLRAVRGSGVADAVADKRASEEVVWGEGSILSRHAERRQRRALLNEALKEAEDAILAQRDLGDSGALVVGIDNLDRCGPEKLVSVLESLHNFSGLHRTRFLLVGDEEAITEAVRSRYPTLHADGARAYVEKVVSPVFRMPTLASDAPGLKQVLKALGIEGCVAQVKAASGLELDVKFLIDVCRHVFQGNPRKALHMFRSLPSFAGQWNYGTRKADIATCGASGIAARWILETHAPEFLRDAVAMPARLQNEVSHLDVDTTPWQLDEKVSSVLRQLAGTNPSTQTTGLHGPKARLGAIVLLICRGQFPDGNPGATKWQSFISSFLKY